MQSTLPKLAVFAKFVICLLMVVMPEAAPVESSVQLFNQCTRGLVSVDKNVVYTSDNDTGPVNMKMESYNHTAFTIYNIESQNYLCFNKGGKLVARPHINVKGFNCFFKESIEHNYHQYHAFGNDAWSLGFNRPKSERIGRPLRPAKPPMNREKKRRQERFKKKGCYNFTKRTTDIIGDHNDKISKNSRKVFENTVKQFFKKPKIRQHFTPELISAIRHKPHRLKNRTW